MRKILRLGFLASGRGSNVRAIVEACRDGRLPATPVVLICNNAQAGVLTLARSTELPARHLSGTTHPDPAALDQAICATLREYAVDLVVLAGYMKKLGPATLQAYHHRIINIHPALLPRFGGQGMYGLAVHEAVLRAGERESGATVHLVEGDYDRGRVLAQRRVPVLAGDTAQGLAARVLEAEHVLYVETLRRILTGEIALPGWDRETQPQQP